jgi:hypothetical protein
MMIAGVAEPMVAGIFSAALAVVLLVAFLSRREYWLAERLGFPRSGGSFADAAVPPGL